MNTPIESSDITSSRRRTLCFLVQACSYFSFPDLQKKTKAVVSSLCTSVAPLQRTTPRLALLASLKGVRASPGN